jgi:ammonia channel protein AmtB
LLIGIWTKQAGIFPGFDIYSYITVGLILISGVVGGLVVETPYAGLVERISAIIVHQWLFVLGLFMLLA